MGNLANHRISYTVSSRTSTAIMLEERHAVKLTTVSHYLRTVAQTPNFMLKLRCWVDAISRGRRANSVALCHSGNS